MSGGDASKRPAGGKPDRSFGGRMATLFKPNAALKEKKQAVHFNPEADISHKREWAQRQQQDPGSSTLRDPSPHLFEHFTIVGLPPTLNVKAVSADIRTYHTARQAGGAGMESITPDAQPRAATGKHHGLKGPALPAEVLFSFPTPPPHDLAANLAAFCHPHGVRPELLERTPSMSSLNEVIYSQPYQNQDDHSFVFLMKVADGSSATPRPLYGVCCLMQELVHRPPALARAAFPACVAPLSRYMVAAPRCYCLLTHYPFFALHFRVLQTILGLERLDRMTALTEELSLGMFPSPGSSRVSTIDVDSPMPYGSYPHTEVSTSSGSGSVRSASSGGFVTPLAGITEDEEVEAAAAANGSSSGAKAGPAALPKVRPAGEQLQRRQQQGEASPLLGAASGSQDDSEEMATPSSAVPVPATPYFTPAPNTAASAHGRVSARRAARHHGQGPASPGPAPAPAAAVNGSGGGGEGQELADRMERVRRVLADNLAEVDARLAPSPVKGPQQQGAASESVASVPEAPFAYLEPDAADRRRLSEVSEASSQYATAVQSSAPSGTDLGRWPPDNTAASGRSEDPSAAGPGAMSGASSAGDLAALNETLAMLLATSGRSSPDVTGEPEQRRRQEEVEEEQRRRQRNGSEAATQGATLDGAGRGGLFGPGAPAAAAAAGDPSCGPSASLVRVAARDGDPPRPMDACDLLRGYRSAAVPAPGQTFEFQPDPGLQAIAFRRPDLADALHDLGLRPSAAALPDIDAAQNLGGWAVASLCRCMSLDSILTFLTAVLLERQVVVFCPNVGLLSGIVLSLVPLLLPFAWQSLMLPVLPATPSRLDLLEAPVPFVVGVVYKTAEVAARCGSLVRVNVYKDKVKNAGGLPPLPQLAALADALAGPHAELRRAGQSRMASSRPAHHVGEAQQLLAACFMTSLQKYLKGLVADLKGYTITDVSQGEPEERVSVLLQDSFVDSFPQVDRPFMRQFTQTQMFSVYCDSVL